VTDEPVVPVEPRRPHQRDVGRAQPRAFVAVAGGGCAVAVLGTLLISGDQLPSDGGGSQAPGIIFSLAVIAAGFLILARTPSGPLATAGAVASLLAVPPLFFFLGFDTGGFPPYSTELILAGSALAWTASYLWSPGKGRLAYLGGALGAVWLFVVQVIEQPFDAPFLFFGGLTAASFDGPSDAFAFDPPDPATMGVISLLFGIGYLVIAGRLDRSGFGGRATPFVAVGLLALAAAVVLLAGDLEEIGTALILVLLGTSIAMHGATVQRRFTTWLGGFAVAVGVLVFVTKIAPDDDITVTGLLLLLFGVGLVILGHRAALTLQEPDELAPGPSSFAMEVMRPSASPPEPPF
jgi:hypothetical protein